MKNLIINACGLILGAFLVVGLVLILLTPEKTPDGSYTDFFKYWTDSGYIRDNFTPKG